ncbi:MAG: DinB family protein [Meiothermus sp.]|nr:DinB family protein [Meiothermus sp.]
MDRAELLRLVDGHGWIWGHWWGALMELSPEQLTREVGGSFPSVLTTVAHMVGSEQVWQMRCEGQSQATFPPVPDNLLRLKDDWDEIAARRRAWLETVPLDLKVNYTITYSNSTAVNSVSEVILHMTSHTHFHRGQLVNHLRALGVKPPSVHLIGYFRL